MHHMHVTNAYTASLSGHKNKAAVVKDIMGETKGFKMMR